MNILVMVNDMMLPNKGGGAPRVDSIVRALVKEGHNVVLFAPFETELMHAEKELGCKLVNMKFIPRRDPKKILKTAFYTPFLTLKVLYLIKKHKIDVIFAHNIMSGFPAMIGSKVYRIPFAFDPTDFIAEYIPQNNIFGKFLYKTANHFEVTTAKKSDVLITNTKAIKDELEKKHNKNVYVVYDSVNFKMFHPEEYTKDSRFVYILQGGMDLQDGLQILVPVIKILKEQIEDFQVWLVGDGNAIPALQESIKKEGLEKYFWFSGWVPQDKVREYMCRSDVGLVILPREVSGKIRLTLRMLEYWACKKPVVAPRLEAVTEVVNEENGLFYEAEDAKSLANSMLKIYSDKDLRDLLGKNGFVSVKDFDSELQGRRIVDIMKNEGLLKPN